MRRKQRFTWHYCVRMCMVSLSNIEIIGAVLNSIKKGFISESIALKMIEEGIGTKDLVDQNYYPASGFLTALNKIGEKIGAASLMKVGSKIMESAVWPPNVTNLEQGLASINEAYKMNHRPNDPKKIGEYQFKKIKDAEYEIHCTNPYPCDFDQGLVMGVAKRFNSKAVVLHSQESCRKKGQDQCIYKVRG